MDLTRKKVFGTDSHGCCLQSSLFFCVDPHFHLYNFPFSMQVSLNISCAVGLLETSSFGSCIAESIFLSSSFRSDVSAGLRSSRLRVCLWGLERCGSVVFSCFAAYVNSALYLKHRFLWLLWRYVSLLLVSNRFFFFLYDGPWCRFLPISCSWASLSFLELWLYSSIKIGKISRHYFLQIFSLSPCSFRNFSYMHIFVACEEYRFKELAA